MRFRSPLGVLIVAIAALLVSASPALAKGGGGGGGGGGGTTVVTPGCASIDSWQPAVETVSGRLVVVLHVGVFNGCVDEGAGAGKSLAVSLTNTDSATGTWLSSSTYMAPLGQGSFDFFLGSPTATPPATTLTVTVTRPNGQVQDSRTTTLAEVLASVQPAA